MKPNHRKRMALIVAAAAFLMLAGLGWQAAEWRAKSTDAEMRERLLQKVVEIANIVNPELARKLTFTAADKNTPAFEQLREQMTAYGKAMPLHCSYSMVLREGKIFFGPETTSESDPIASPPGTEYKQPPAEAIQIFKDKRPVTVGPVTDEFGMLVSALAPVLDPHTGEILMVVGLDMLAGDWQARLNAARRGPLLGTLAMMLLLSGGAVAIRRRNRRMKAGTLKLKVWIVAPTALAILVGLAIYGAYEYQEFDEESLHGMLLSVEHARGEWNRNVASEVNLLKAQIDHIARNPAMLKAWQNRDLPSLIALAQPAYEQLKRKYRITHFYFMAPDRTIFLRVHQPDRRGDLIDRSTLLAAERTGEDSWGVELGPLGTFTLRYVRPWKQNGKTTGYLELGMEIEHLAGQLARNMNLDVMTVIRKEYITREKFEAGRQAFGFVGQWDAYRDFVVAHQTIADLPREVAHWLEHDYNQATGSEVFSARQGEKRFACGAIHLPDATGRGVADLIVMRDVTVEAGAAWNALLLNLGLVIVLFGGLLVLLWSVTGTAERQLGAAFAQLRESEEYLGATLRSIGDGVISTDVAGNVNSLNAVAEALTGWTRAEAQGRPIAEVFHIVNAQTRAEAQNPVHRALAEGRIIGLANHTALIARDGTERKIADSCAPIRSAEGRITGAVLVFRDVTEEYRMGEALRESEERFRILNDNLSVGVAMIGPDMGILAINPRIRQWFPRTDPTGHQPCYDAFNVPPRNEPCTGCPVVKTLRDGQIHVFEREVSTCDGIRVIWITSTAITDRDGNVTAVIEMIDDITERKRAEEALRESEEKYRTILENIEDGYYEVDLAGNLTFFNDSVCRILGYSRDELMGVNNPMYTDPENSKKLFQAFNKVYRTGEPVKEFNWEVIRKDGTKRFGEVSISLIKNSEGNPIGFRGIARDIT